MIFKFSGTSKGDLLDHDGMECEIIKKLGSDVVDLEEGDPMYRIKFIDGFEIDCFIDEISGNEQQPR